MVIEITVVWSTFPVKLERCFWEDAYGLIARMRQKNKTAFISGVRELGGKE